MTKDEVVKLLKKNKNDRGASNWEEMGFGGLKSFGLGLTQLKKISRAVGRNHELAQELWDTPIYDAKLLATMVDERRKVTREQVEKQVEELEHWGFSHAYCSYLLPKVAFEQELVDDWTKSEDDLRRRCGYLVLSNIAKNDKKLEDDYFKPHIQTIVENLQKEKNFVRDAMNTALWMIGQRNRYLNHLALQAARQIGKVEVDYGDNSCEAIDVVKHLTSERLQKRFMGM